MLVNNTYGVLLITEVDADYVPNFLSVFHNG
jgi:hypothetical protein